MKNDFKVTNSIPLRCRTWRQEALLRLLENVLAVGNEPDMMAYATLGRATRDYSSHVAIVHALQTMTEDYTLIIQSGKPVGLLKTHAQAPLVIMANCNMVGHWAKSEVFYQLERKGLICWGGLSAGAWQYIGSQAVIQSTYEIFSRIAERYYNNTLKGHFILTAGLGAMGSAQALAAWMVGAVILVVEIDPERIQKCLAKGYLQQQVTSLEEALIRIKTAIAQREALSLGLLGNAAVIFPEILARGFIPHIVTDQTPAHDLLYGYIPADYDLARVHELRQANPKELMLAGLASIKRQMEAMLGFHKAGSVVFDHGNLIRTQAYSAGVADAFDIPVFTEAFLRPLFCRAIGPFRWIALSNDPDDIHRIDEYMVQRFADNHIVTNWIGLAQQYVPFEGLPARIAWLGHGERTELALAVNQMVADGRLKAPVAFTRDHLDAGAMAHPYLMTENLRDGSDVIADWPLINAMLNCASGADLVAIHSSGGGDSGYMTSAGVTIIADGTPAAAQRLQLSLTNDTSLSIIRYADAGYPEAIEEAIYKGVGYIALS
ncbi:urocanate hydratase [Thiolinea disciformis]|uniref:urocanate hydratase n=1 Tax=Thiolinea disciformis TaxID=125614 RepID=UPI0003794656|nr:urocanate hydratase [Thiolinea disciformis]